MFSYEFDFSTIKPDVEAALFDHLGYSGTLDSMEVWDPMSSNDSSIAYLVYHITAPNGDHINFGHRILRRLKESIYEYYLNEEELNELYKLAPEGGDGALGEFGYECTKIEACNGCKPHRTGFLGLGGGR